MAAPATSTVPVKYDAAGRLVHHSFLGSADDLNGFIAPIPKPPAEEPSGKGRPRRSRHRINYDDYQKERLEQREKRSLDNWNKTLDTWERQQNKIVKQTGLPPEKLNMHSYELKRQEFETRDLLERAMPQQEEGKGWRHNSEFWTQAPFSKSGLIHTLTKSERGEARDMEYIGKPQGIHTEVKHGRAAHPKRGWMERSTYLEQRRTQLVETLDPLLNFQPDIDNLFVAGHSINASTNIPAKVPTLDDIGDDMASEAEFEAVEAAINAQLQAQQEPKGAENLPKGPMMELRLLDASAQAKQPFEPHEGLRVLFTGDCQQRLVKEVALCNTGDTVLFFQWHRIERDNNLGRHEDDAQRFFIDCEGGSILPGDSRIISAAFCSPNSGIFAEEWKLSVQPSETEVEPVLSLYGVVDAPDRHRQVREDIKKRLELQGLERAMRKLVEQSIARVWPREREPSTCLLPTKAESFMALNPGLCTLETYSEDVEQQIHSWYRDMQISLLSPVGADGKRRKSGVSDDADFPIWDRSVDSIYKTIANVQDDELRENLFAEIENLLDLFTRVPMGTFQPPDAIHYGADSLKRTIDGFSSLTARLAAQHGIPIQPFVLQRIPSGANKPRQRNKSATKRTPSARAIDRPESTTTIPERTQPAVDPNIRAQYRADLEIQAKELVGSWIDELLAFLPDTLDIPLF